MPRKQYAARVGVGRRRETAGRVSISGNVAGAPSSITPCLWQSALVGASSESSSSRTLFRHPVSTIDRFLGRSRSARSYSSRSTSLAGVRFT